MNTALIAIARDAMLQSFSNFMNLLYLIQNFFSYFLVYFDATQDCHELGFSFGQNAIGTTIPTTRAFSIKVKQFLYQQNIDLQRASLFLSYLEW